jgi:hypothetical protein
MSSILKALKKLEHEKAVKKPGAFRIEADILRGESTRRTFSTGVLLAAIAIFACGVGATYFYMKHDRSPVIVQTAETKQHAETSPGTILPPASSSTAPEQATRVAAKPSPQSTVISTEIKKLGISRVTPPLPSPRQIKPVEATTQVAPPVPVPPSGPAVPVSAPVKPVLKLDGIAFQDGASTSVAVINGITVSKGSVIEGAGVEEILKDRVRLSRDGEKFEIILDKSH